MKPTKPEENITQVKQPAPPVAPLPTGPKIHQLADGEKALLQGLNIQVLNAKGKIHDLNVALEQAQRDLATAMAGLNAGLAMVGTSAGIANSTISPDFKKITGAAA